MPLVAERRAPPLIHSRFEIADSFAELVRACNAGGLWRPDPSALGTCRWRAAALPRNDDWSYRAITWSVLESGNLELDGASQSIAIGQVLPTIIVLLLSGGSDLSFWFVGLAASIVVVVAGYKLARQSLPETDAAFVVLTLLIVPGYLAYSSSFMTDVPALAGQLVCLWLGILALRSSRFNIPVGAAAIAFGLIAFSVRQFALADPSRSRWPRSGSTHAARSWWWLAP